MALPTSSDDFKAELLSMVPNITRIIADTPNMKVPNKAELQLITTRLRTIAENMDLIIQLKTAVNSEDVITTIKEEIAKINQNPTMSFATAVKRTPPKASSFKPSVIIEHKDSSKGHEEVLNEIKKTLSFKTKGYAPNAVKRVSNNKIRIELENEAQQSSVMSDLKRSSEIKVEQGRKKLPLIILEGISKTILQEDIIELMKSQNETILTAVKTTDDLKLKFIRKHRKYEERLYNAVFEVSPDVRNAMLALGRIGLDYSKINCRDFSPFIQCFKCLQFGHTTKFCSATVNPCSICADTSHQFDSCPHKTDSSKYKCFNCCKYNDKQSTKKKNDINHSATAVKKCPLIKNMIEIINERISYV